MRALVCGCVPTLSFLTISVSLPIARGHCVSRVTRRDYEGIVDTGMCLGWWRLEKAIYSTDHDEPTTLAPLINAILRVLREPVEETQGKSVTIDLVSVPFPEAVRDKDVGAIRVHGVDVRETHTKKAGCSIIR